MLFQLVVGNIGRYTFNDTLSRDKVIWYERTGIVFFPFVPICNIVSKFLYFMIIQTLLKLLFYFYKIIFFGEIGDQHLSNF